MINKAASCVRLSNPLLINLSAGASACLWLYFLMSDQPLMTTPSLPPATPPKAVIGSRVQLTWKESIFADGWGR